MKKIKLVVSDLHLGAGKVSPDGSINSLEEFYYDERFSEFLNYYSTGEFSDCEVELILNGDILNLLQVDYRGHFLSIITESVSLEIVKKIIDGHPKFFEALRKFVKNEKNSITYVIGNHDQGMLWPQSREYLNQVVGYNIRYRNIVYYFDGVHIEHGHMHEPANRIDPKKFFIKKEMPEPVLNLPFGSFFFVEFVLKVKRDNPLVDKVRPFRAMVRWGLLQDTKFTLITIFKLWKFLLSTVFSSDPRKRYSWKELVRILFEGTIFPNLDSAAGKILNDDRIHTVIFGHSHVYRYRHWSGRKQYFNTGTWTELTSLELGSFGKLTKLTYVLLEYPEGANQPLARLKEWRGYHRIEEDVDVT
jgi:UDP-2,3-diacylglucosamine pyrophosphatase LpxH